MKFDRIRNISDQLKAGKMSIEDLKEHKILFSEFVKFVTDEEEMRKSGDKYKDIIEKFLVICNDYYNYSDGDVLITDRQYDEVTNVYKSLGGDQVIYTDSVNMTRWNERKHLAPNMVGSIDKLYDLNEIIEWLSNRHMTAIKLSPKYDGCSIVLSYDSNRNLIAALTRKDGVYGQDLTPLVKEAEKYDCLETVHRQLSHYEFKHGKIHGPIDIKCEILVGTTEFEELRKEKPYKNRRAAASAISANPSNIKYAKYLTFMPLVGFSPDIGKIPLYIISWEIDASTKKFKLSDVKTDIRMFEAKVRSEGEYRKDGVIITACGTGSIGSDIMSDSVAYKFNTQMAKTTVESCYLSIGRTGKATPMIKVLPCEVNETEVTDVNLSNFKKVNKLDLHIGDEVVIESAGDVIPMIKEVVVRNPFGDPLVYSDKCPHCGHILKIRPKYDQIRGTVKGNDFDLYCNNPNCIRIVSGRLINFLNKMGAKGISDGVMSSIVELTKIREFYELFDLNVGSLSSHSGWGSQSELDVINEISRIKDTPHPYSLFLGALGIPLVSVEKCRALMQNTTFERLMKAARKSDEDCINLAMGTNGFGSALASNVAHYLADNYDEVSRTANSMNLYQDEISYDRGNVVLSGFRDEDLVEEIEALGYKYSDNINKNTIAVITANLGTGKAKKAMAKGIPIYMMNEYSELLSGLRNNTIVY